MDNAYLSKLQEILVKFFKKGSVFGFVKPGTSNPQFRLITQPNYQSGIPFYLDPGTRNGGDIIKITPNKIKSLSPPEEETSTQITNLEDYLRMVNNNLISITEWAKANPELAKEKIKNLNNLCFEFEDISYPLFTQETTFELPKNLARTLHSLTYGGSESCGNIVVSKFQDPKLEPIKEQKRRERKKQKLEGARGIERYKTYECIFYTTDKGNCVSIPHITDLVGEIHFHTHPILFQNQEDYLQKFRQGQAQTYIFNFITSLIKPPSGNDLLAFRDGLISGRHHVYMVFTFSGIYVVRMERLIKDLDKTRKMERDLTQEELNAYQNQVMLNYMRPLVVETDISRLNRYLEYKEKELSGGTLSNDERQFLKMYFNYVMNTIMNNNMLFPSDINNIDNAMAILAKFFEHTKINLQEFSKKVIEHYINLGNNSGNKIIVEFNPASPIKELFLFTYPQIKVKVFPMLHMNRPLPEIL